MAREIILDTETTGLDPASGHRVIEIACLELEDFIPTGRSFHRYIHPERDIDPEAERVHGISLAMLKDRPKFHEPEVCDAFLEFVEGAKIVAHNAAFDRGFINHELERAGRSPILEELWACTYVMAKNRFRGMHNSLDALCKRFKISLAEREKHGALVDCRLLAQVYLELRGGRERDLGLTSAELTTAVSIAARHTAYGARPRPLGPRSTEEERAAHEAFVASSVTDAIWLKA